MPVNEEKAIRDAMDTIRQLETGEIGLRECPNIALKFIAQYNGAELAVLISCFMEAVHLGARRTLRKSCPCDPEELFEVFP